MAHNSVNNQVVIEIAPVTPAATPVSSDASKSVNYSELISQLEAISRDRSSDTSNKGSECFDIAIFVIRVIDVLSSLGMGIWAAIVLANTSRYLVSEQVYAYVMTCCILHFVFVIAKIIAIKPTEKIGWVIGTGMLVWNCEILFSQIGIENYMLNNYYYYVFVQFVFSMVMTGIAHMACCLTCCACTIALTKDDN